MAPLNGIPRHSDSLPTHALRDGPALFMPRANGSSAVDLGGPPADGDEYRHLAPDFRDILDDLLAHDPQTASRLHEAATVLPQARQQFHGFTLVRELGRGAFARVFLARQPAIADRPVVVKIAANAVGEVRVLAQLQHTNIVPVYSVHMAGSVQIVVMPFLGEHTLADLDCSDLPTSGVAIANLCRGHSVAGLCEAGPTRSGVTDPGYSLPTYPGVEMLQRLSHVDAVLHLAVRLTEGLAFAHAHGIVHCDVKPANILLTAAGEPMLLDFNVADDTKLRSLPAVAVVGGSFPYMAPEQLAAFRGQAVQVDARCDLYSFGVVLYELLTGHSPFAVAGRTPASLDQACHDRLRPPPRLRSFNAAVPPALEAIVRHCLEGDPARRYQSAADLLDDLRRQLDNRPLRVAGNPSFRERARKFGRRHPGLMSATTVAALAAGLLFVATAALAGYRHQVIAAADREAAAATWAQFRTEARAAQYRLSARLDDADQIHAGATLARTALGRYGLPDEPDWRLERPRCPRTIVLGWQNPLAIC